MGYPFSRLPALVLAIVAGALIAAPTASAEQACPASQATPASATKRQILRATLCELNRERAHYGLRKLKLNRKLSRASRRPFPIVALQIDALRDVLATPRAVGDALGEPARGEALARRLGAQVEQVRRRAAGLPRRRVLFVVGREPLVVEAKSLRPRVELDPACARVQAACRLLDRLLCEVEARKRDEHAARSLRGVESAVVRRPEGGLAVRLVQAKGEGSPDAVPFEERKHVVERGDEAVDVAADVDVDVEELGAIREQRGYLVVVEPDELPCTFQSVLHRFGIYPS